MSKLAISQTPTTITVVDQNTAKVYTTTSTQPNWIAVNEAIKNEENDDEIVQLMSVKGAIENFSPNGEITVVGNDVRYLNHTLHGLDVDHLLEAIRNGNKRQAKSLTLFLKNKQDNPSYKAINMMYKFRQDKGMPLTDDGCFLAYKGVLSNYWSRNGNKDTIVLSGQVNEEGQILNSIGSYIEVDRKCVEDDPSKGCGEGLHAGSMEYATSWGEKVIIVKIHPKDVVSVPDAEDNKMRICAYTVVGECEGRMPEHFSEELNTDFDDDFDEDLDEFREEAEMYADANASVGDELEEDSAVTVQFDGTEHRTVARDSAYDKGYRKGTVDGRARTKRQYYEGDELLVSDGKSDFISGYNAGYKFARYGK